MRVQISIKDGALIYLQIMQQIKYLIACGRLQPGDELPAVRTLAEQLVINPNTVTRAYRDLEATGLVVTQRGKGVYVADTGSPLALKERRRILDEPSSGLDVASRRDILEAIVRTVADEGRTVVFSSHLLEEVERVADTITMLHRGAVVLDGPLDDIKTRHGRVVLRYAEAQSQRPDLPGILFADGEGRDWTVIYQGDGEAFQQAATQAHAEIVESVTPTLEDISLAHTGITTKGESASNFTTTK